MRKTKMQKGITLIALVITIVVLLILAIVSINLVINGGIITHAENAVEKYDIAQTNEQAQLAGVESYIEGIVGGGNNSSEIGKATVGIKVEKNSTIDGKAYSSTNPIIPAGFTAINSTIEGQESNWDAEGGPEVDKGLEIRDDSGNEFVWVPVLENEFSSFAVLQDGSTENYRGVLYNWRNNSTYSWSSTSTDYREPANLTGTKEWSSATTVNGKQVAAGTSYVYDGTDMFNLFDMGTYSETYYQDKFNDMVASVAKYGGFYVGRYETSLSGNIAQSKEGQPVMNRIEWYKMYKYSEAYSQSGVISEMIWGCQWDAMMRFIGSRATETGNVSHDLIKPYKTGGTDYTGTVTYNDISKNIYDLEGNVFEWTQEAYSTFNRVNRGRYIQPQPFT